MAEPDLRMTMNLIISHKVREHNTWLEAENERLAASVKQAQEKEAELSEKVSALNLSFCFTKTTILCV